MNPNNKIALISGAASGIGFSIAKELLKNIAKGVAILDINPTNGKAASAELNKEFGDNKVIFIKTDVTNIEEFEDAFKKTIEHFGQLDIVVNSAGILKDTSYITEMNINLGGTCNGIMLGLKYMGKDKMGSGGVIVNMASIAAFAFKHIFPMYTATKAGVLSLTQGWGHSFHFNRTGVKIVALCPGGTLTPLLREVEIFEECDAERTRLLKSEPTQKPEAVSRSVLHLIANAETSSAWLIEDSKLYKINFPDWKNHIELVDIN